MIERILEIMPIQRIDNYNNNRQSSRDNMKRKDELIFGAILEKKMNQMENNQNRKSDAYHLDLRKG